jgi:hypothetical protein
MNIWGGGATRPKPLTFVANVFLHPDLRCWFTNHRWCRLRDQRLAGALVGNQLLPNTALKHGGKAVIDLIDGLSSGSVVLVSVADDNFADHDARLEGGS